ncbi:MAG: ECF transporter S component, partial [Lachnospiraceae bacterium]|nr:ECF transporter S component [Lachnospiraceae bacterium]
MDKKIKTIALTGLLTACVVVGTMIVKIPIPATGGYIHPGDGVVLLCGLLLGPIYGPLAAGLGSMLADLFSG